MALVSTFALCNAATTLSASLCHAALLFLILAVQGVVISTFGLVTPNWIGLVLALWASAATIVPDTPQIHGLLQAPINRITATVSVW